MTPNQDDGTSEAVPDSTPAKEAMAVEGDAARFPIVGVGASAGGLAAFEAFFSALPTNGESGMAFVLVQHLAPDHKSILSDLIRRYTPMEVFEVEDGMIVKANCAYIIRPNCDMAFVNGALRLQEPRGQRLPIDYFFRSLAEDQHERAIGIVLSGTGSDGMLGVRAIKGEGGMVMAQNPESTDYDGMPRSAIATGLVDFVLPPAEMPSRLIAFVAHSNGTQRRSAAPTAKTEDPMNRVFSLLETHTGHDFSQYKQNTIRRRIERRMAVRQIAHLGGYVEHLEESPAEVEALFRDLLIGVTHFFRDVEAFKALEEQVVARIVAEKQGDSLLRVWVPGCSTGEEAYSIAILLREKLDALKKRCRVQIFATDIDPRAVELARAGVYPSSIAADVTPERFAAHFSSLDDGSCRIHKAIRDLMVFSEQDVTKDPPFSKLDIISCRNVMIYMGPELQKRLIPLFHYALLPGGTLFLGTSETVGEFGSLFAIADRKEKIYRRKEDVYGVARPALGSVIAHAEARDSRSAGRKGAGIRELPFRELPFRELAERALLRDSAAAALVDERGELLYLHGQTGQFLQPAPGEIGVNILKMAREGLRHELTSALHRATSESTPVFRPSLRIKTNGGFTLVDVTVRPVSAGIRSTGELLLYLVIFEPLPPAPVDTAALGAETQRSHPDSDNEAYILELKRELRTKDEYLRATQEEMQTSNEELRSSNEELQSTNEELQSTNEELETSKEELQSVNEELATVNAELQSKVGDLSRVNNDMNNLLAGTGIGTVFVDLALHIRRFTPAITQFINLIQTDIGRPLGHTVSNLMNYDQLVSDVQAVIDTLAPMKVEVQTRAGAWYLLSVRPYRTAENTVEGAVIAFTEMTALKAAQSALLTHSLGGALRDATDAITVQDLDGRILTWNPGAVRMYGWSESEALSMNIRDLLPEDQRENAVATVRKLSSSERLEPYRAERLARNGERVAVTMTVTALVNAAGAVYALATTERGMSN